MNVYHHEYANQVEQGNGAVVLNLERQRGDPLGEGQHPVDGHFLPALDQHVLQTVQGDGYIRVGGTCAMNTSHQFNVQFHSGYFIVGFHLLSNGRGLRRDASKSEWGRC